MGNVDLPEEIEPALRLGAQGVGLLRTEFLLTGRATLPTEDEQAAYFRRVALAFPDRTVIIRSFDLGGDKFPAAFKAPHEANPVPRLALDPGLPGRARGVPAADPGGAPGRVGTGRPADAARWSPGSRRCWRREAIVQEEADGAEGGRRPGGGDRAGWAS